MFEIIFKIWWMIAVLPYLLFLEGSERLAKFLKEKNIYQDWDVWHTFLLILVILLIVFWMEGFRF